MANQSLRNSFFVAKITACLPRYSLTFAISAHDSPSFFFYPFKYCCSAAYPHYVCSFLRYGATFVVTSKTEFEERRRLSSVAFWPSLTKAALKFSLSVLEVSPPPSSSHIFQNRLRWTRTEKKQTSNWIKTTVSLFYLKKFSGFFSTQSEQSELCFHRQFLREKFTIWLLFFCKWLLTYFEF